LSNATEDSPRERREDRCENILTESAPGEGERRLGAEGWLVRKMQEVVTTPSPTVIIEVMGVAEPRVLSQSGWSRPCEQGTGGGRGHSTGKARAPSSMEGSGRKAQAGGLVAPSVCGEASPEWGGGLGKTVLTTSGQEWPCVPRKTGAAFPPHPHPPLPGHGVPGGHPGCIQELL
jgi:hypothetical protein